MMSLLFFRYHNRDKLTIVYVVVLFRESALTRVKGSWPEYTETDVWVEEIGDRKSACICLGEA